jgi:uncharacterized RDD family membrane protein YckC
VGSRLAAAVIDLTVLLVGFSVLVGVVAAIGEGAAAPDWLGVVLVIVALFGVVFVYPVACEVLCRGRTLGKAALGLRVVTVEGAPVGVTQASARAALGLIDLWVLGGAVAVVSVMCTRSHQRLGDLVAGTVVLRDRAAEKAAQPLAFHPPYGYEGYTAGLDVAAMRPDDYTLVRSFLTRVGELTPEARSSLAHRLAVGVAARTGQHPPDWIAPEVFLVCAAAAYQRRPVGASSWGTMGR